MDQHQKKLMTLSQSALQSVILVFFFLNANKLLLPPPLSSVDVPIQIQFCVFMAALEIHEWTYQVRAGTIKMTDSNVIKEQILNRLSGFLD